MVKDCWVKEKRKSQALPIKPDPSTLQRVSWRCGQKGKICTTMLSSHVDRLLPRCLFLTSQQNNIHVLTLCPGHADHVFGSRSLTLCLLLSQCPDGFFMFGWHVQFAVTSSLMDWSKLGISSKKKNWRPHPNHSCLNHHHQALWCHLPSHQKLQQNGWEIIHLNHYWGKQESWDWRRV